MMMNYFYYSILMTLQDVLLDSYHRQASKCYPFQPSGTLMEHLKQRRPISCKFILSTRGTRSI